MKRFAPFTLFGLGAVILAGCPIYPDSADRRVCDGQYCYDCPSDYYSYADCMPWSCGSDRDCPSGYACNGSGICAAGGAQPDGSVSTCTTPGGCPAGQTCGADGTCHTGDCTSTGCPVGYQCKLTNGTAQCVTTSTDGGVSEGGGGFDSGPVQCRQDSDCTGDGGVAGARCLDGQCVAPADQCTDGTQCSAGSQCVQGACTPTCDPSHPCPTGYACDTSKGVCTGNPSPCGTAADAGTCTGSTVCAQDHCVTPCSPTGTCAAGLVCVEGGCVPNQKPQFTCAVEGKQDVCASGSICLHHSCYIACTPDAGTGACKNADTFNVCKSVATSTGTYSVCGSSSNLGTDCDPTQGKGCTAPLICIDGFCR